MKGSLAFSLLICAIFTISTSSQSWPCQRDKHVRKSLSQAISASRFLAEQIATLRNKMSRRWPLNPFNASNIGFFGPRRSSNKTGIKILKANILMLGAFISLIDNSTSQLRRFQAVDDLVNKMVKLNTQTRKLNSRILRIITSNRQGETSMPVHTKPVNMVNMGSTPTIQDVARRTQLILIDFRSIVLTLANDLRKIAVQTCN